MMKECKMGLIQKGMKHLFSHGWKKTVRKVFRYLADDGSKARLDALERRVDDLERNVSALWSRNSELGFDELGGRIDYRLTRLEILQYYASAEKNERLDDNQKDILRYLQEDYFKGLPRKFPVFSINETGSKPQVSVSKVSVKQEGALWFWDFSGKKIYLGENQDAALDSAGALYHEFFEDSPHRYLEPEKDGIDVPEGAVLADVGAAEGLFGMLFVERCKKIYLFESEQCWIDLLKKTFAPYMDKIEIVKGTVGDGPSDIKLDDFFKDKEPPTFVKMDIEGYEVAALKGMTEIIHSNNPLSMLICTYHRQSDWDDFYELLHDRFEITSSPGYFWHMPDPFPPFFRHGVMRARKKMENEL